MAYVSLPSMEFSIPGGGSIAEDVGNPQNANLQINADGNNIGLVGEICPADDGKAISVFHWRNYAVGTADDVQAIIGAVADGGGPGSNHVSETVAISATGHQSHTFASPHTVSAGDRVSCYFQRTGGTVDFQIRAQSRLVQKAAGGWPYYFSNGSPQASNRNLHLVVEFDDGTYWYDIPGLGGTNSSATYNNGDTDAEHGLKFQLAAPMRACGVVVRMDTNNVGRAFHLYNASAAPGDTGATRLATTGAITLSHQGSMCSYKHVFTSAVELAAGTVYRLTCAPTSGSDVALQLIDGHADSIPGMFPPNWIHTQDDGAGGWTDTASECPMMGLLIDGIDNGAGGGGGGIVQLVNGGLVG